jgi:hypothetical protein
MAVLVQLETSYSQTQKTYCNPVNLDYGYTPIPNFAEGGKHRATADPVIVNYKNEYYLFSTNQWGYWQSNDMVNWNFLSRRFLRPWNNVYDELCAPAIGIIGDTILVMGSTYSTNFTIWMSTDPGKNEWKPLVDSFAIGGWDPDFFTDDDGVMYCDQTFGDYPIYLPFGQEDHLKSKFTGWMLLNYNKPVAVSSTLGGYCANNAVDEDIKTYWSSESGNDGEWIQSDMGNIYTVKAIQINYADQDALFLGKSLGVFHQYRIFESKDGRKWNLLVDKSRNKTDVPHDYVELAEPVKTRYLKLVNKKIPTGKFAISGFRIFGNGSGDKPSMVKGFAVLRTEKDKRSAWLKWNQVDDAYAYNIFYGIDPGKLYNSIMIYNSNEYWLKTMDKDQPYFFAIEAINENGISERSPVLKSE